MKITAAVTSAPGAPFAMQELTLDDPRADEILVRIVAVGLCHTDLAFKDQPVGVTHPAVLGHEGAGVVEKVGADVTKVAPGDRVLLTFRSCGACPRCLAKDPCYCAQLPVMNFIGMRPDGSKAIHGADGDVSSNFFGQSSFASHALAYERNVVKLEAGLPLATYEPLGCGVQTGAGGILRSLNCPPGSGLVVIGTGTVGLSAVMAGKIRGCSPIIAIDLLAERRALALEMGATHALDPAAADIVAAVRAIAPLGVDNVLDTSGHVPALTAALGYLAPKGTIGLVGVPNQSDAALSIPLGLAITFGFGVRGIIEGDSNPDDFIPELISLHRAGKFPFDRLITNYPFDQINQAIDDQHHGKAVKVVLLVGEE